MKAAGDEEDYSWQKTFLYKRRQDFIASILEGEGGSTYDAIRDAAYSERLVELENEYDPNFNIWDVPVEEMEGVYEWIESAHWALKDATDNKHAVIMNMARNAPTELELEEFVMIIILKVSSNQKQANKENGVLGFIIFFTDYYYVVLFTD